MTVSQFNFYYTQNDSDRYCLLLFDDNMRNLQQPIGETSISIHHILPYCLRLKEEEDYITVFGDLQNVTVPSFTFIELKERNITSEMLLSWSSTIDLAEEYEIFLMNESSSLLNIKTFYNCTSFWFGPFCRFKFDYSTSQSFYNVVRISFRTKRVISNKLSKVPCYVHLSCKTYLSCLDWREICDGNSDCMDGEDEQNCWQLEVNQCTYEEYRCHNGQCIPKEFVRDAIGYSDCFDQTDEPVKLIKNECYLSPSFLCEKRTYRLIALDFSCTDGEYTDGLTTCSNGYSSFLTDDFCSEAMRCLMDLGYVPGSFCIRCKHSNCIKKNCPILFEFRAIPPIFGHIRLLFSNTISWYDTNPLPIYLCYDDKLCENIFPDIEYIDNFTCHRLNLSEMGETRSYISFRGLVYLIKNRFRSCLLIQNEYHYCNYSSMYQCKNSRKCIANQRLMDGFRDCRENDDEEYKQSCLLADVQHRFRCSDDESKCFSSIVVNDGLHNCEFIDDEHTSLERYTLKHIDFLNICDGKTNLFPIKFEDHYETDETNCEYWPCNNIYTRCNKIWNCPNAIDEMYCSHSLIATFENSCLFPNIIQNEICPSVNQTDKQYIHQTYSNDGNFGYNHCWNDTTYMPYITFCDRSSPNFCLLNGSAERCTDNLYSLYTQSCKYTLNIGEKSQYIFCVYRDLHKSEPRMYFKLSNMSNDQLQLTNLNTFDRQTITRRIRSIDKTPIIYYSSDDAWRCNRGISIRIQTDVNRSRLYCLCPPSYYGDECQYQNQRVSITVQIRVSSNWRNLYVFLLTLIDHERNIESYDYIEYLPIRDCDTRYNTYLLYSSRPKNFSKTYSVQITAYDQTKLTHRTSWIFPLQFSFLPVYSLPVFLKISTLLIESANKQCSPSCIHGQCLSYINNQSLTYCHCESSWSGIQCNVKHKCNCALGSLCISDTICLCSSGHFGRRCHLIQMTCQTQPCLNGGQCIVEDVRYNDANQNRSICICLEGYTGDRCQYQQNQTEIQLLFDNLKTIPSFAFVHLILVRKDATPKRITLMKKIRFDEYSIKLSTSILFHIAFVQIFVDEYYLIIVRENVIISEQISTKFLSSSRCRSITELFDEKFSKQHLIKRIKYYHIPCREIIELNCFYDEVHLCLCTNDRQANCFEFDYNKTYDCDGTNICEHSGKCFLDDDHCPTSSVCTCPNCFFGSKCQYSTQGSTLSLDIILGYHIRPNLLFYQQRIIVKIALILMSFIFVFGVINSFLSFQTFRQEQVQNVGCGLYLYTSSIISMMIILFLTLKFSFLLIIQMNFVSNRTFYYIQCLSIDFILRSLVCTTDWLSAFVALERAINAMMGVTFNKMKSKQMAKRIIWLILIFSSISFMYDPLHRDLSTDEEEEHTWCVTKYSSTMRIIDRIMNIFHFSIPFLINLLSAIVIIFTVARTRSQSQKTKSYEEHLCSQIQYHKHLLISPFLLILLAIPRLIISFVSSCMQSARNAWFYLFGYFISFIPSMLTFEIFVLPSEMYRKEFKKWTSRR